MWEKCMELKSHVRKRRCKNISQIEARHKDFLNVGQCKETSESAEAQETTDSLSTMSTEPSNPHQPVKMEFGILREDSAYCCQIGP